jgi:hypothetical protein
MHGATVRPAPRERPDNLRERTMSTKAARPLTWGGGRASFGEVLALSGFLAGSHSRANQPQSAALSERRPRRRMRQTAGPFESSLAYGLPEMTRAPLFASLAGYAAGARSPSTTPRALPSIDMNQCGSRSC